MNRPGLQRWLAYLRWLATIGAGAALLLVVLVFLAAFAGGVPSRERHSRADRTVLDIGNLEHAFNLYNDRRGKFPETATGFQALIDMQIIDKMPKDAWGNDYVYTLEAGRPIITSYGADGVAGGRDLNADISNRPVAGPTP